MKGVGETVVSYLPIVTQDDDTDVVSLEVKSHALNSRLELHHLTGLDLGETEDTGNTITDGDDGTELLQVVLQDTHKKLVSFCFLCRKELQPDGLAAILFSTRIFS